MFVRGLPPPLYSTKSRHFDIEDIRAAVYEAAEHEGSDAADGGVVAEQVIKHCDGFTLAESTMNDYLRELADRGAIVQVDGIDTETMFPGKSYLPADYVQEGGDE